MSIVFLGRSSGVGVVSQELLVVFWMLNNSFDGVLMVFRGFGGVQRAGRLPSRDRYMARLVRDEQ